jgi:cellulose synthase/poly-beta-1,6-N-acetylglucosamine synthase-like glycosyltransferase
MTAGVLVCTYLRPQNLERCLGALALQARLPDQVIVVVRETDAETRAFLNRYLDPIAHPFAGANTATRLPVDVVLVNQTGVVAARNAGLEACRTDVLAIVDDDTEPHVDWLARVVDHFVSDPGLGGLGGRDRCHDGKGFLDGKARIVGNLSWYGRRVGNHHLGFGAPREVYFLKGCNMSFRMKAVKGVRFDTRLRGLGVQPHEDSLFSLAVRRTGWRLLYDPAVMVDHYEGPRDIPRHYGKMLPIRDAEEFRHVSYNWAIGLWEEMSLPRHAAFIVWSFLVGTRVSPGLVQAVRFTPKLGLLSWHRFWLSQQGIFQAYATLLRGSPAPALTGPARATGGTSDR